MCRVATGPEETLYGSHCNKANSCETVQDCFMGLDFALKDTLGITYGERSPWILWLIEFLRLSTSLFPL